MVNEFRQDLVSGDWVLFSTKRKHSIQKFENSYQPKEDCPFEDLEKSGQEIIWFYPEKNNWKIAVIRNKFPAVKRGLCEPIKTKDYFKIAEALGEHNVIVFKDHDKNFADLKIEDGIEVIRVYKRRYQELEKESSCVQYIMIFHNFGKEAGASIYHPHSQIISIPILPPDISRSINGSYKFFQENKKCVYDLMIDYEKKEGKRIIYENDSFITLCPFVSKFPYEVRIFPKDGSPNFEKIKEEEEKNLADALITIFKKIKNALKNPPYNFFIHTAPPQDNFKQINHFYTWHIEILPKVSILAGFELGTGIDINVVDPDYAAEVLRNA